MLQVIKDYFDKDMKRVDDEEQAIYVKITSYDPIGLPVCTKIIKKEES